MSNTQEVTLSGANEVPPIASPMSGTATVTINPDRTVNVKVTVTGMTATASHIHEGAPGTIGPVIVPFTKTGDNTFVSAEGAKLTEEPVRGVQGGQSVRQRAQRRASGRRNPVPAAQGTLIASPAALIV